MEIGMLSGLAQDLGYDKRIEDAKYFQQQMKQKEAMDMAKAKMFADDIEFVSGSNNYDSTKIKEYTKAKLNELASFRNNNPNWASDPNALMQMKYIKNDIKGNEHVLRSIAFQEAKQQHAKVLQKLADNPEAYDPDELAAINKQFEDYSNRNPAEQQGAFVYTPPTEMVNLVKDLPAAGKSINDFNIKKGKNIGEWESEAKPEAIESLKQAYYSQHPKSVNYYAKKLGLDTPEKIDNWLTQSIMSGIDKKYSPGDVNALWERGMEERKLRLAEGKANQQMTKDYTVWDDLTNPKIPAGNIPVDIARKIWNDKPKLVIQDNSGTPVDFTGLDFNYDGRFVKVKGVPLITGYVDMPLETAQAKGVYTEPFGPDLGRKGKITSEFLDKAQIIDSVDKDGNPIRVVRLDAQIPVNPKDQTAKQKYESWANPSKLVTPSENPYNQQSRQPISASREDFMKAGYNDEQIKKGIEQGLIILK